MEQIELKVMKMGCGACVARVTTAIQKVPGTEIVSVRPGRAVLRRDPSVASDEQIINSIKAAGYDAAREVPHAAATGNVGSI